MEEYDYLPDTTEEKDQIYNTQGLYNLPKPEHKQRHSYDYVPQYYIQHMEQQAKEHNTARTMQQPIYGQDVGKKIINYYVGQKHYTPEHAEHIKEAVEGKIHASKVKSALRFAKKRAAQARRPKINRIAGIREETSPIEAIA